MPELNINSNRFNNLRLFIIALITSAALLFVYSKNSLIYEMNDYVDVNLFFSVTDSLFHGSVLYRDIFEHKGPFLYLIYSLAHILGNSYFTLYLFECVSNALFIYFGTKTILLYDKNAPKLRIFLYLLCLEFCLCTAASFMFGGVVEELLLWILSYGMYVTLRWLKQEQYYSKSEIIFIGLLCGALFWTKFTLLGFYSALALYIIIWHIKYRNLSRLGKTILLFFGGFAISSIPTILYCSITHSFGDMVSVYFVGNIFGKHETIGLTTRLYTLNEMICKDIINLFIILFGSFFVLKYQNRSIRIIYTLALSFVFLTTCCMKVFFVYYPMPMLAFLPIGIIAFKEVRWDLRLKCLIFSLMLLLHLYLLSNFNMRDPIIGDSINPRWLQEYVRVLIKSLIPLLLLYITFAQSRLNRLNKHYQIGLGICLLLLCATIGFKIRDPYYFKDQTYPQIQFKEEITQIQNASIFVYDAYDFGFFKASQTYPQVKYFCRLNLIDDYIQTEQLGYIKNGIVDFFITTKDITEQINDTSYVLIDSSSVYYMGYLLTFFLYKKI